jgi:hypothetical protein
MRKLNRQRGEKRAPKVPIKKPNRKPKALRSNQTISRKAGNAGTAGVDTKYNGGKLASVIGMLRDPKGTSINALCEATGWQAHSVRGAISGAIKKRLGLKILSEKSDGIRIYRIVD